MSAPMIVSQHRSHPSAQAGFTLMEVLIAVTITAVIGLGVWQVLGNVVSSRDRVNDCLLYTSPSPRD